MKKKPASRSAFFNPRVLISFAFGSMGLLLALLAFAPYLGATDLPQVFGLPATISNPAVTKHAVLMSAPTANAIRVLPGCTANTLPANDDNSTLVNLPFTINYFGTFYAQTYVNNNGNITFSGPLAAFTPSPLNILNIPIMAPFFADVDTRGALSGLVQYGNTTVGGRIAFCTNWVNVGYFASHTDLLNSFQIILIERSDTGAGNFDIEFNYNQIVWETGDASGGMGGQGGNSARAGYANGNAAPGTFFEFPGSAVNGGLEGTNLATGLTNNSLNSGGVLGRYTFNARNGGILPPPSPSPSPTPLTVNKTADTNDGVCNAADCSLREALGAAGSNGTPDTIIFNIPANSAGCVGTDCTITLTSTLAPAADAGQLTTINGYTGPTTITLSGNGATQIFNLGTGVNLSASNLNFTDGNSSNGGAISIAGGGTLRLTNSALFGNTASLGGAIYTNSGSVLNLTNVTISGNTTTGFRIGGGIYKGGAATVDSSTISNNSATFEGGVVTFNSATFNIRNTIIAGNTATSASPDANGNFTSQGYNLIGNPAGANGFTATGDQTGVNAQLAPLGNNGGPTRTHALQAGSPAINAGDPLAPPTDQRGFGRNGVPDKGAYEFNGAPPAVSLLGAVSRKTHGGAGTFDIPLPLTGEPGVECRSSSGAHTLVFSFSNNIVSGNASLTSGMGSIAGSPSFTANTMTLNLTGVLDVQKITVALSNVTDSFGQVLPNTAVSVNMLIGDINASKVVNASDIGAVKAQSGAPLDTTNFRSDVAVTGSINATDIGLVKSRSGQSVP